MLPDTALRRILLLPRALPAQVRRLAGGRVLRSIAVVLSGTALGQVVVMAVSPLLTRLYEPSEFGVFTVYLALMLIFLSISCLRYDLAVPLPERDEDAAALLAVCAVAVIVTSAVVAIIVALVGGHMADWLQAPDLAHVLWLLPVGLLAAGMYQVANAWAVRRRDFNAIARTRLAQGIGMGAVQVGLGVAGTGSAGLVAGSIVGQTSGLGSLARRTWQEDRGLFRLVRLASLRAMARRYRRYPLYVGSSALLNTSGTYLAGIILAVCYGPVVAGFFGLAQRLLVAPLYLLGRSVSQVYIGEAAAHLRAGRPEELRRLHRRIALTCGVIGLVPVLVFLLAGPQVVAWVFGARWEEAGEYLRVLSLMLGLQFLAAPVSQTLTMFERVGAQAVCDVVRFTLGNGGIVLVFALGGTALESVAAYSAGSVVALLLLLYLNQTTVSRAAAGQRPLPVEPTVTDTTDAPVR